MTTSKQLPDREDLKEYIHYNPETGEFRWRKHWYFGTSYINRKAGTKTTTGYWELSFRDVRYLAHRLAFVYMGEECPKFIDHIDRNPLNNQWTNLRAASSSQNQFNRSSTNGRNLPKGIDIHRGKYRAVITRGGNTRYLGVFESLEEAVKARETKALELYGDFSHAVSM